MNSQPILNFSVSNNKLSANDLEQKVREIVLPNLSGIDGVADVQLSSQSQKAVYIKLIPNKLQEYRITPMQVMELLQNNNISNPAGSVIINNTVEPIRITGKYSWIEEFNDQIVLMPDSAQRITVKLKDIAEIISSTGEVSSYSRTNGNSSVVVKVIKTQESNTVDVSNAVIKKLDEIKNLLPDGTNRNIILNQAEKVNDSVNGMLREGILGAIFAFIVILLFLRNFRTTLIATISMPLSVLITLIFLKQFNISLNIMTLGGLSVAMGRIVDDSIVVIENIYRHLHTDNIEMWN